MAALLRLYVTFVPLLVAVGTSAVLVQALPAADGMGQLLAWWALSLVASTIALAGAARLTRKAMPLAVLLRLSLAFPDEAPSRWKVARRAANVRDLEATVERARAAGRDDEPIRAAEHILELVAAVEAHDRATRGHSERVRIYTDLLAEELRLPVEARDRLRWAALLHDVGKLMVPAKVLNKPSKLTANEWELVREHPLEGAKLIEPLRSWLGPWATAVDEHHERFDGGGYPYGRTGAQISLGGRMLAVTDAFETMTAMRAYKRPMTPAKAREELVASAGSHFDPTIVRAFLQISVRRLGLLSGPVSWLAQMPVLRGIEVAAANAARGAGASLAAGGTAFAIAVVPAASAPQPAKEHGAARKPTAVTRSVERASERAPAPPSVPEPARTVDPDPVGSVEPEPSQDPVPTPTSDPVPGRTPGTPGRPGHVDPAPPGHHDPDDPAIQVDGGAHPAERGGHAAPPGARAHSDQGGGGQGRGAHDGGGAPGGSGEAGHHGAAASAEQRQV